MILECLSILLSGIHLRTTLQLLFAPLWSMPNQLLPLVLKWITVTCIPAFLLWKTQYCSFTFSAKHNSFFKMSYIKAFCFLESCTVILHNQYSAFGEYIRVIDIFLFLLLFPPLLRDQKFMNATVRLSCHFKMFVPEKWKS